MTESGTERRRRRRSPGTINIIDVAQAAQSIGTVSRAIRSPEKVSEPARAQILAAVEAVG